MSFVETELKLFDQLEVNQYFLKEDGNFPNNASLPLVVYKKAVQIEKGEYASKLEEIFIDNNWGNMWINGVYNYHHYHSTAHEVLGVYKGNAKVQFGGPNGVILPISVGDIIIIPAGVAHKNLESSMDFSCVGAYPKGQNYDMNYGNEGERPEADERISQVPLPVLDPIFGEGGPLCKIWGL